MKSPAALGILALRNMIALALLSSLSLELH